MRLLFIPYQRRLVDIEFNTSASSAPGNHRAAELPFDPIARVLDCCADGARTLRTTEAVERYR